MINALKDLNSLPASESKKMTPVEEVANSEVEYFESENLRDLEDIETSLELVQLLLKSSRDKKFICEAAEKALEAMTTWVSPTVLLPRILIQAAASQHSESREAAQTLLLECKTVYKKSYCLLSATVHKHPELDSWEHFRRSKLSSLSARAVLQVTNTNVAQEGLVVSS
ncbi:hypothetical protein SLEP1_g45371 [Rubroshorea leprosula]|uniref:Uncharacterized protein n=1 Tax=Rubroshorea leprosula TaxID=152421 RepID=A0AAV5LLE4_9ROSI|nr:hypothetical protein SLEP1_g45371 [Rubroshorea leprosula]